MAWHIHDHVIRGEIDNRTRGKIIGKLWLHGMTDPVPIELDGDAQKDLAGTMLKFINRSESMPLPPDRDLKIPQRGKAGDITASRKVHLIEDFDDADLDSLEDEDEFTGPLANCLYIEWYHPLNGRMLIESTDFELEVSAPAWLMTPAEEELRERRSKENFEEFLRKLTEAVDAVRHAPPDDKEWDEFDYELMMRESDARTDKYIELLEKYGDQPDGDDIIAREMGWDTPTEGLEEFGDEDDGEEDDDDDVLDEGLAPEPHTEGVDWIRTRDGEIRHPVQHKCSEAVNRLRNEWNELGLSSSEDVELRRLMGEFQITSAKLAGALNSLAYGRDFQDGAFVVACLKRALGHLHKTLSALESVTPRNLLPQATVERTRTELFSIREDILRLMDEFRGR